MSSSTSNSGPGSDRESSHSSSSSHTTAASTSEPDQPSRTSSTRTNTRIYTTTMGGPGDDDSDLPKFSEEESVQIVFQYLDFEARHCVRADKLCELSNLAFDCNKPEIDQFESLVEATAGTDHTLTQRDVVDALQSSKYRGPANVMCDIATSLRVDVDFKFHYEHLLVFTSLLPHIAAFVLQSTFTGGQEVDNGPRKYTWSAWLTIVFWAVYVATFFIPHTRASWDVLFGDWHWAPRWLFWIGVPTCLDAQLVMFTLSNGKNLSNTTFLSSTVTTTIIIWALEGIFMCMPNAYTLTPAGQRALRVEKQLLERTPCTCPQMGVTNCWELVEHIRARREPAGVDIRQALLGVFPMRTKLALGVGLVVCGGIAAAYPVWIRLFYVYEGISYRDMQVQKFDWIPSALLGASWVVMVVTCGDYFLRWNAAIFVRLEKNVIDVSHMINAREATLSGMPYVPLFADNNDYAFLLVRKYVITRDLALFQKKCTTRVAVCVPAVFVAILALCYLLVVQFWELFVSVLFITFLTLFLTLSAFFKVLLVNEAVDDNTRAVGAEVLLTAARLDDSSALSIEAVSKSSSIAEYLKLRSSSIKIAGVPVTRTTVTALRALVGGASIVAFNVVTYVLGEVGVDVG